MISQTLPPKSQAKAAASRRRNLLIGRAVLVVVIATHLCGPD
jgi:hypothetical protein